MSFNYFNKYPLSILVVFLYPKYNCRFLNIFFPFSLNYPVSDVHYNDIIQHLTLLLKNCHLNKNLITETLKFYFRKQ